MRPLIAAVLCSLVATCGQKGPLSLPGEHDARLGPAPAFASAGPPPMPLPVPRPLPTV